VCVYVCACVWYSPDSDSIPVPFDLLGWNTTADENTHLNQRNAFVHRLVGDRKELGSNPNPDHTIISHQQSARESKRETGKHKCTHMFTHVAVIHKSVLYIYTCGANQ